MAVKRAIFILIVLSLFVNACSKVESPRVIFNNYRIDRIGLYDMDVVFFFDVINPNPLDLVVFYCSYNVYVSNQKILEQSYPGFMLDANKKKQIAIPVSIKFKGLTGVVASLIEDAIGIQNYLSYKINGQIKAEAKGRTTIVRIKAKGKIKIPEKE